MSNGFWAYGTIVQFGDGGSPEAFTAVAELLDTGPIKATRDSIDMTNHQTPDGYEDILPTIKRSSMASLSCNWIPDDPSQDGATGLASIFDSGRRTNFKVLLPDTGTSEVDFAAYVMSTGPDGLPVTGAGKVAFALKPVGKITWP